MFWSSELFTRQDRCIQQLIIFWQTWLPAISSPFRLVRFSYLFGYPSNGFRKVSCKILVLTDISIMASGFSLTVLAVERYHALLKPFRAGLRLKEESIKHAIVLIWISSVSLIFPEFFLQEWGESHSTCIGPWSTGGTSQTIKIYVLMFCVFNAYIPIAVFVYCYGSLIKGLYFSHTICVANTDEERSSEKKETSYHIYFGDCRICYRLWTNCYFLHASSLRSS